MEPLTSSPREEVPPPPPWVKTESEKKLWSDFWEKALDDLKVEMEDLERRTEKETGDDTWKEADRITRDQGSLL